MDVDTETNISGSDFRKLKIERTTWRKDRSQWKRINYAMEKERGWSVGEVYVQREDGTTVTHNTESEVQDTIWNKIHCKRFYAAERAPICQGKLCKDFTYTAVSPAAEAVL